MTYTIVDWNYRSDDHGVERFSAKYENRDEAINSLSNMRRGKLWELYI
jgi:hypothetical protein